MPWLLLFLFFGCFEDKYPHVMAHGGEERAAYKTGIGIPVVEGI